MLACLLQHPHPQEDLEEPEPASVADVSPMKKQESKDLSREDSQSISFIVRADEPADEPLMKLHQDAITLNTEHGGTSVRDLVGADKSASISSANREDSGG